MLALLVFRHSSRPRHICHFFLRFTYVGTFRNINFDFSNSRASQMMNRSMKRVDGFGISVGTNNGHTSCLGTRQGVGRAWFPRHASWEQAGRMGHGHATTRLRASHVAHAISVRVRLCPRSSRRDKLGTSCFPSIPRSLTKLTLGPLPSSTYCTDGHFRRKFADREGT